jgi:hypothetical protein
VEVELINDAGESEPLTFELVSEEVADFEHGFLGVNTPLAQAIRGKAAGKQVDYRMADIRSVRIVTVRPSEVKPAADVAERRQAVMEEALRKAERTNADMFASSFSGKWGDYNTDGMTGTE